MKFEHPKFSYIHSTHHRISILITSFFPFIFLSRGVYTYMMYTKHFLSLNQRNRKQCQSMHGNIGSSLPRVYG